MATYRVPVLEDFAWQPPVDDRIVAPTESETKGTRYLIIATASGIFAGKENQIATAKQDNPTTADHWYFDTPSEGWTTRVLDENANYIYDGAAWDLSDTTANESNISVNTSNITVNSTNIAANASTDVLEDASIDSLESEISTNLATEVSDVASIDLITSANASLDVVQDASIDSLESEISGNTSTDVVQSTGISTNSAAVVSIDTRVSNVESSCSSINTAKQDKGTYVSEYGAIEFTV